MAHSVTDLREIPYPLDLMFIEEGSPQEETRSPRCLSTAWLQQLWRSIAPSPRAADATDGEKMQNDALVTLWTRVIVPQLQRAGQTQHMATAKAIRDWMAVSANQWAFKYVDTSLAFHSLHLQVIPDEIRWFANRFNLNFSDNELRDIPASTCVDQVVHYLTFDRNHIGQLLSYSFRNYPALTHLSLCDNEITQIDADAFANCPLLQEVNLAGNKLSKIAARTFNYPALEYVDLRNNLLCDYPDADAFGPALRQFCFQGNPIVLEGRLIEQPSIDF